MLFFVSVWKVFFKKSLRCSLVRRMGVCVCAHAHERNSHCSKVSLLPGLWLCGRSWNFGAAAPRNFLKFFFLHHRNFSGSKRELPRMPTPAPSPPHLHGPVRKRPGTTNGKEFYQKRNESVCGFLWFFPSCVCAVLLLLYRVFVYFYYFFFFL